MEKYTKIFSLPNNLYIEGSPVLIESGDLYMENASGYPAVILKLKNLAENRIRSAQIAVWAYDYMGAQIGDKVEFKYFGLDAGRGKSFGDTVPVYLPGVNTVSVYVTVTEAIFDNGSFWKGADNAVWEILPVQRPIREALDDFQIAAFRELFGKEDQLLPQKHLDLILCTCGTPNKATDISCSRCRCRLQGVTEMGGEELRRAGLYYHTVNAVKNADIPTLLHSKQVFDSLGDYKDSKDRAKDCLEKVELIKEEEAKVNSENRARKMKILRRSLILGVSALILVTALLLTFLVFVPASKYSSALAKMEVGNFDEAREEFEELNGYRDSETKIELIHRIKRYDLDKHNLDVDLDYQKILNYVLAVGEPINIVLNTDGGAISGSERFVLTDECTVFATPEKKGYVFEGWALELCTYTGQDGLTLTFGAEWNGVYKIEYDLGGGVAENPDTYDKDGKVVVLSEPTKRGYNFIGWTGTDLEKITFEVTIPEGSYGDREYTAHWEPCIYSITLDPKGGTCDKKEIIVTYGEVYTLPKPEREGYRFVNWVDSTGKPYTGGNWSKTENVTLSAKWVAKN